MQMLPPFNAGGSLHNTSSDLYRLRTTPEPYFDKVDGNDTINGYLGATTNHERSAGKMAKAAMMSSGVGEDEFDNAGRQALHTAIHVLQTEAEALMSLKQLYAQHPVAKKGFTQAVAGIAASQKAGGKLVVVGVGKSGKIGKKMESTMNSLGLLSMFLNPVEALHGDLGILRPNDIILLITFSGNTPELLNLLPHIPAALPVIALTAHTSYQTLKLTQSRPSLILLPAPIPESEQSTFDLCAPTTSTTVALALGDALALAVARAVHTREGNEPKDVFRRHHPGGAIGKSAPTLLDLAVPLEEMTAVCEPALPVSPPLSATASDADGEYEQAEVPDVVCSEKESAPPVCHKTVLQCLTLAIRSRKGWLRLDNKDVIPPRRLQRATAYDKNVLDVSLGLVIGHTEWVTLPANTLVEDIKRQILAARAGHQEADPKLNLADGTVIAATLDGLTIGVLEVADVLEE